MPLDFVRSLHNAFRRDVFQVDDLALRTSRAGGDFAPVLDRVHLLGEVLDYHAKGEEAAVFPAVDKLAPFVAKVYVMDQRELDNMISVLETNTGAFDLLVIARATAVLASHLRIHLDKEDAYLYPLLREHLTESEQVSISGLMSKQVPSDRFPILVHWLFPLLGVEERVAVTQIWMNIMPPQAFASVKQLIQKIVGDGWSELTNRVKGLQDT